jgi:YidC/Oxa1 family membrane protein insertase
MHLILAASWLDPIVDALYKIVLVINKPVGNLGWSMVILAALIRAFFWPLNTAQFKSMMKMQKIAPLMKRLQDRYKDDKQKQQQETMALYREHGVNPLAGCWPMLVQYPVIIAVYWVVINHKSAFANQSWLWIGSTISQAAANLKIFGLPIMAASLSHADLILVLLYAFSMYLSVRYVSVPATDPQQAQMQRNMAILSPLMLGFFGWRYQWPSAMVLYWFSYNILTMAQQFYLLRRYHQPLALIDSEHVITEDASGAPVAKALPKGTPSGNGAPQAKAPRSGRSKRRNKR